jgi:heavy metal sensor kinase
MPARSGSNNIIRARGNLREIISFTPPGEAVIAGINIGAEQAELRRLGWLLFTAGAGVLLLGLAGGWWMATRAIRPIQDISTTAAKISAGDLSQRIETGEAESELGQLAGVLNSTFARLDAAFAQQKQFTSDAAHELRTPVSVILTQIQSALTRERSGPEYRETLEACQRAAQRMRRLIESLLELARFDAGQQPLKQMPFDLAAVARDCAELVQPLAEERGVVIFSELPEAKCQGDSERVGQVVTNLLTNAVNYNRRGGEVWVRTRLINGSVELSVADSGPGIPEEHLPKIFDRFYRVDTARTSAQGRSGLGLAICKAIVEAHGGSIAVANRSGGGAEFSVRLPTT